MLNESGQTLVAVLMVMIISLAVGLSISQRIIGGQKRSTSLDSSSRALAVAEAAVEKVLTYSSSTLDGYITNNNCASDCQVSITGTDGVVASATVSLSYAGNTSQTYDVGVSKNFGIELDLTGYSGSSQLELCWDNASSGYNPSVSVMHAYGASQPYTVSNYAYNSTSTSFVSNGFSSASPDLSYQNCFTLPARSSPRFVRVRAIYNDVSLHVIPKGGATLPTQGYLLTSSGSVGGVTKTIEVIKSKPYLPSSFDFVIFNTSESNSLSN